MSLILYKKPSLFLSLILFFVGSTVLAQVPDTSVAKLHEAFPKYTQLSIAIIEGDQVTYYGYIQKEAGFEAKENSSAVFQIGSISKVFTAALLADQVEKRKLKLDDPLKKYLDFKIKGNPKIKLVHLSNHTSTLPRLPSNMMSALSLSPDNPYKDYTREKLRDFGRYPALAGTIGETYAYSNLGAGLLGYALSQKTKKSYEELLQEMLFQPLEMNHSTCDRSLIEADLVRGLDTDGTPVKNWDFDVLAPAGAIHSNVVDLSKFVFANFDPNHKAFALQRQKTFTLNKNMDLALGWHIIHAKSGNDYYWHNGAVAGYTSHLSMDIEHKRAVIILSNVSAFNPAMGRIDELGFELMKQLESAHKKN